jgi:glycosyltransferase involved in cell wall biosynthesis
LCVARIEPRKNQLRLVRALRGSGIPLLLVGRPGANHGRYYSAVKGAAGEETEFRGYCAHERLPELYGSARVHVLPSWFETPGLASLEAAASGCGLVVTDRGSTRDYFGENALYCEPESEDSIRSAVLKAWEGPPSPSLRRIMSEKFTWEEVARLTRDSYSSVLGNGGATEKCLGAQEVALGAPGGTR